MNQWIAYNLGEFVDRGFLWVLLERKGGPIQNCVKKLL